MSIVVMNSQAEVPTATPDNMICGICSSLVVPKKKEKPEHYPRCCICKLAFCYPEACSGAVDWIRYNGNQRITYKCSACKPERKKHKPKVPGAVKRRSRKSKSDSAAVATSVAAFVAPQVGGSVLATSTQLDGSINLADESSIFNRSTIISHSPKSPDAKRRCHSIAGYESEYDGGSSTSCLSDVAVDTEDDELGGALVPPNMDDQKAVKEFLVGTMVKLYDLFKVNCRKVRKEISDQQFITNKLIDDGEEMRARIVSLERMCTELSAKCDSLQQQLATSNAAAANDRNAVSIVEAKCDALNQRNEFLEIKSRALDDYSRQTNTLLAGLPSCANEQEAVALVFKMADVLGIVLTGTDIYAAHSLPSRNGPPRLLVKFTSRMIKASFVALVKSKKLSTSKMGWAGPDRPITASDHLSPATAEILSSAKRRLHWNFQGRFKYIWTKQGRILAKVADGTKVFEIKTVADIEKAALYGEAVVAELQEKGIYEPPPPPKQRNGPGGVRGTVGAGAAAQTTFEPEPMIHSGSH